MCKYISMLENACTLEEIKVVMTVFHRMLRQKGFIELENYHRLQHLCRQTPYCSQRVEGMYM